MSTIEIHGLTFEAITHPDFPTWWRHRSAVGDYNLSQTESGRWTIVYHPPHHPDGGQGPVHRWGDTPQAAFDALTGGLADYAAAHAYLAERQTQTPPRENIERGGEGENIMSQGESDSTPVYKAPGESATR